MIAGAVDHQRSILSPSWRLAVELCAEVGEEEAEDVRVRIALGQREPYPPVRVDGRHDGEPRTYSPVGDRGRLTFGRPVLPHKC